MPLQDAIQQAYAAHRAEGLAQQRRDFLAADFPGLVIDQHLLRLQRAPAEAGFRDERHCLVFWARPPNHLLRLAARLQQMLLEASPREPRPASPPSLLYPGIHQSAGGADQSMRLLLPGADAWLMPTYQMHLTTLEVAFSRTADEIAALVSVLRPLMPAITSYTHTHRARLVKPLLVNDRSAFALTLLPASGEPPLSPPPTAPDRPEVLVQGDAYTYHHLRRDLYQLAGRSGLPIAPRYQVASAHLTLGRFLDDSDHDTPEKRLRWVGAVDRVNQWLAAEVWDKPGADYVGEWLVGHEKGLDARCGTLWYGGGRTIILGEGF